LRATVDYNHNPVNDISTYHSNTPAAEVNSRMGKAKIDIGPVSWIFDVEYARQEGFVFICLANKHKTTKLNKNPSAFWSNNYRTAQV